MSPTSTRSRAAPDGPIPSRLVSVVPVAFSAAVSSLSAAFLRWYIRSRSLISSAATRRRACRRIPRPDPGWQRPGLGRGQGLLRPAGDQVQQQPVQLGDHPGVVLAQGPAPVRQDPQHRELSVIGDQAEPRHPGSGQRNRVRIGHIGLTALPGRKDPGPGRQLRRHVHDLLPGGDQPGRDVPADPLAALDRPGPRRPLPSPGEHRRVPGSIGAYRPPPRTLSSAAITSIVADRLCGSIPITTVPICFSCPLPTALDGPGGHRYSEHKQTPLEPLPAPRCPARAGQMRATRPAWAADVRATNRAPRPSLARHRS